MKKTGKITKILANFYYVQDNENKIWECFARGRLLKEGKLLFVGDNLDFEVSNPKQGVIVDLKDRNNRITKPPVSNVEQVLVVFSSLEPDFDFYNLDRYLSFIRYELPNEKIIICINKTDLKKINITSVYENSGHDVYYISALTKEGTNELANKLTGKTTVLAGPSGVGKSSIINTLVPSAEIKTGSMSQTNTGRHTTRNVQLVSINNKENNGFVVDTPGFTNISFIGFDVRKVLKTFKELNNLGCGFNNCLHTGEEGCVLKKSGVKSLISESRFNSYLNILEETQSEIVYRSKKEETKVKFVGGKEKVKAIPKTKEVIRAKSRKKEKQELSNLDELEN